MGQGGRLENFALIHPKLCVYICAQPSSLVNYCRHVLYCAQRKGWHGYRILG